MTQHLPWHLILPVLKKEADQVCLDEFNTWIKSPPNKETFEKLEKLWQRILTSEALYEPNKEHYWKLLEMQLKSAPYHTSPVRTRKGFYLFRTFAAVAAMVVLLLLGMHLEKTRQVHKDELHAQTYVTYGGKSQITLPDGTLVWLHNNSSISYSFKERKVTLQGEAYFEVVKNDLAPFIVEASDLTINVYGTKFNVSNRKESKCITVGLLQGSVAVETTNKKVELKPYQEVVFNKQTQEMNIRPSDINYMVSWAKDSIHFENQSLSYVCKYLSKWYGVDIRLNTPEKTRFAYTFTVTNEPLQEIMRLIVRTSPNVSFHFDDNNVLFVTVKNKNMK